MSAADTVRAEESVSILKLILGLIAGLASAAIFGLISVVVHRSGGVSNSTILFVRAAIGLTASLLLIGKDARALLGHDAAVLWLPGIAGAVSILCFYWNLHNTTVGVANVLFQTSLIFTVLIASAWRRDTPVRKHLAEMSVGLGGALAAAIGYNALKIAAGRFGAWTINLPIMTCLALLSASGLDELGIPSLSSSWAMLAAIGLGALVSQLLLIVSFRHLPVALATTLSPTSVLWGVGFDTWLGHTQIPPQALLGLTVFTLGIAAMAARVRIPKGLRGRQ
jgi:drug/metabolite transporter (DMT)-like permease